MVKEIKNTEEFQKEVMEHEGYVIIDFWAEWCGPCKTMEPEFKKAAEENTDVKFVKVNVDENREVASQFGIMSIPTLIIMNNGTPVNQTSGALQAPMIKDFIENSKE